jgi:transcriptional regulator with XRE-family HTH domain
VTDRPDWRDRLRVALDRSNKKHSFLARQAGIAPGTLSRILNGHHRNVSFETICRLADATEVRVGWLLNEPFRGIELSDLDNHYLRSAVAVMLRIVPPKR